MVNILVGWIAGLVLGVVNALLGFLARFMISAGSTSLALAHQPWVSSTVSVTTAVAGGLLFLALAWKATAEYILWNEGTSSDGGAIFFKGVLRVIIYGSAGTTLAYMTFRFGILFAAALMAAPVHAAANGVALLVNVQMVPFDLLVLSLGELAITISLIVVALTMFVRAAELCIYVVAAPLVALGQFNPQGGIWQLWWKNLVILSLSTAVQWLCLHGMVATVATTMLGTPGGPIVAVMEMAAWAYVAIRGPHLLQQWSYRTGFAAGGSNYFGAFISRTIGSGTRLGAGGR